MKLVSLNELFTLRRAFELAQEELDAVDRDTDWILTTGADEEIADAIDLLDTLIKSKDA